MRVITGLVVAASFVVPVASASAQPRPMVQRVVQMPLYPQCMRSTHPVGCRCALESGGKYLPQRRAWVYPDRGAAQFAACMRRAGR